MFRHRGSEDKNRHRRRSRSRDRDRDRDRDSRRGRSRSPRKRRRDSRSPGRKDNRKAMPPPPAILDRPEKYGVYRGIVKSVINNGVFVELMVSSYLGTLSLPGFSFRKRFHVNDVVLEIACAKYRKLLCIQGHCHIRYQNWHVLISW